MWNRGYRRHRIRTVTVFASLRCLSYHVKSKVPGLTQHLPAQFLPDHLEMLGQRYSHLYELRRQWASWGCRSQCWSERSFLMVPRSHAHMLNFEALNAGDCRWHSFHSLTVSTALVWCHLALSTYSALWSSPSSPHSWCGEFPSMFISIRFENQKFSAFTEYSTARPPLPNVSTILFIRIVHCLSPLRPISPALFFLPLHI